MRNRPIVISRIDAARLRELLATRARAEFDQDHLPARTGRRARTGANCRSDQVPAGVITIHARVQVHDLVSGERRELTLVLPRESDASAGRIRVGPTGYGAAGLSRRRRGRMANAGRTAAPANRERAAAG